MDTCSGLARSGENPQVMNVTAVAARLGIACACVRACVPAGVPWLDVLGCVLVLVCACVYVRMVLFNHIVLRICPCPRIFVLTCGYVFCFPRSGNNSFTDVVIHFCKSSFCFCLSGYEIYLMVSFYKK